MPDRPRTFCANQTLTTLPNATNRSQFDAKSETKDPIRPAVTSPLGNQPANGQRFLTTHRFHVLLTLFPKFFSSFDHSTCMLSVSSQYLALGEVYHLIGAAVPNSPTPVLGQRNLRRVQSDGAVTLDGVPFQAYFLTFLGTNQHIPYNATASGSFHHGFRDGLVPCSLAVTSGIAVAFLSSRY